MCKILLTGLALLAQACGHTESITASGEYVEASLEAIVSDFDSRYCQDGQCATVNSITVGDVRATYPSAGPGAVGVCTEGTKKATRHGTTYLVSYKVIILDEGFWYAAAQLQKTTLLFHELGHCKLGLAHTQSGVMSPLLQYYRTDKEMYSEADRAFNQKGNKQ